MKQYKLKYNKLNLDFILDNKYLLTQNEKDILDLLLQGYKYKEIAKKLYCSERTVKRRKKSIYFKTLQYM